MTARILLFLTVFFSLFFLYPKKILADEVAYTIPFATDYEGFSWVSVSCNGTCTQGWFDGFGSQTAIYVLKA